MHHELRDSGLGAMLKIRPMTDNPEIAKFLGKTIRYKRELLTEDFIRSHGTIIIDSTFEIREAQEDYRGRPMLRGYFDGDDFGRCIDPAHIELA